MDVARWFLGEPGLPRHTLSIGGRLGYSDDGETPNTQVVVHDYATAPLIFEVRGLPAKADPNQINHVMVVGVLLILVIYVTMVYGPIAAMLVEMFPTRIRYTSMSLPYHIGNGWFGGLLPATGLAIVAQTGNMYNGLWYPIIFASMTFVVGMLFVKDTKDVDIYKND